MRRRRGEVDSVPSYESETSSQGSLAGGTGIAGTPEGVALRTASSAAATSPQGRLVHRAPATLRPHSAYLELAGPISATRVTWMSLHTGAQHQPLEITLDGTILDGHVRWRVATTQQWPTLPCVEYDVTDEEALKVVIARHSRADGLNAYCRTALALRLEPHFIAAIPRCPSAPPPTARSSNLTTTSRPDVRRDIARVAGVSTGNVTKVKQILKGAIPEVLESLQRGRPPIAEHRFREINRQEVRFLTKDTRTRQIVETVYSTAEFLTTLADHVPDRYRHNIRYFGLLAPRLKGRTHDVVFALLGQQRLARPSRQKWAASIQRTFGVDPLLDDEGQRMRWTRRLPPEQSR